VWKLSTHSWSTRQRVARTPHSCLTIWTVSYNKSMTTFILFFQVCILHLSGHLPIINYADTEVWNTSTGIVSPSTVLQTQVDSHLNGKHSWRNSREVTVDTCRSWSSGCQSRRPQRGHRWWPRVLVDRTEGQLQCWCRTRTTLDRQTPA